MQNLGLFDLHHVKFLRQKATLSMVSYFEKYWKT